MAAPKVHDKSGKHCYLCKTEFHEKSFNLVISEREGQFIVKHAVCGKCHHEWHSKGE